MRWKISGPKKTTNSLKNETFDLFESNGASRNRIVDVLSKGAAHGGLGDISTSNSVAYMLSSKRMREVEAEKAVMVNVSRHPRWAAGGPH